MEPHQKLTPEQQAHLNRVVGRFERFVRAKYVAGQQEHGGNLWEKRGMLRMAKEEVADLWVYLDTLEEQLGDQNVDPGYLCDLCGKELSYECKEGNCS